MNKAAIGHSAALRRGASSFAVGTALLFSLAVPAAWAQETPAAPATDTQANAAQANAAQAKTGQAEEAPAPADSGKGEEIVVTGSRIASGFSAPTPVSVIGADRLEDRAAANIGDALNELPAFRATNTPASGELTPAAGYVGGRILDLRGLGAVRTLTLVDGKRFVPATTQATVDTNMIPSILLSRAEVVTGGASAQYGSDAVAGVVNLILDKHLEGIKGSAQGSATKYGDNQDYTVSLAGGTKIGENIHLVIGGDYEKNDGVGGCVERPWCRTETLNFGRNPGQTGIPANNITSPVRPSTVPFNGVTVPPSSAYNGVSFPVLRPFDGITFNNDGSPRKFQYGSSSNNLYMIGGEGQDQNAYFAGLFINAPTERYAITGNLEWEVTPDITASLMLNYGHLEGHYNAIEYRNPAINIQATGPNANPFIPRSSDPTLDIPTLIGAYNAANPASAVSSFQLGKGFDEIGPAPLTTRDNVFRAVASLEGKIGSNWSWDAYYQFGRNSFRNDTTNQVITSRITNALQAVRNGAGQIVCGINADAVTANDDPACVAYNPFGNQASAAAKAYVTGSSFQTNITTEHVVAVNLRGKLFDLPYGPLSIAVGGEYRHDAVAGATDALSQSLAFFTGNGSQISGNIGVVEGYVEAEVPLLKDLSFANQLSLNGAIRRTHYDRSSDFFPSSSLGVTTWKFGGVYEPVSAIRFRATKSRDIRAPNVSELFGPTTNTSGILTDPARGGVQTVATVFNGSNPNLKPEVADTFTAGIVLKPSGGFLGRFRLSVDYYDINIKDAISTLGQQNIVTRCFQGDALSCSNVTRDPTTNAVTVVTDVFQNVNQIINRGIDTELDYNQPLGSLGNANFRLLATYVKDLITVDAVGSTNRAGQTGLRAGTPPGIPDLVLDGLVTWDIGNFSLTGHARYINRGFYNAAFVGAEQDGYDIAAGNSSNTNEVPAKTYVDLLAQFTVDYGPNRKFTFFAGVDNLFDTDPPLIPGAHGTGNNLIFSPIGQTFKGGVRFTY